MSTQNTCPTCNQGVKSDEVSVACGECNHIFHISTCAGISEGQSIKRYLNRLGKSGFALRAKKQKNADGSEGWRAAEVLVDIRSILAGISQKLEDLLSLRETVPNLKRSVQLMSDKYDEILRRLAAQERDAIEIRKRLEHLESNTRAGDDATKKLGADLKELERRNRKLNLEIHGAGVSEHESLLAKVDTVASFIEVPTFAETDVAAVHRLPCKVGRTPGIIVRHIRQSLRYQWLNTRRGCSVAMVLSC